jgi:tetratricopeptide (TPR) repeat protein
MYLDEVAKPNPEMLAKLNGLDKALIGSEQVLGDFLTALANQKYPQVVELYSKLPVELRKHRPVMLFWLRSALAADEKEYEKGVKQYRELFPDDPCLDLLAFPLFLQMKQYAQSRASIDRLDRFVGGDPFLDLWRGSTYLDEGNLDQAHKFLEKAASSNPKLLGPQYSLLLLSVRSAKFAQTLRILQLLDKDFGVIIASKDLEQDPEYVDFRKSPEYKQWAKDHP